MVSFANTNEANTTGILRVSQVNFETAFSNGEVITGLNGGATGTIENINTGDLRKYTGQILYSENRPPVARSVDQIEDFKIVFDF